MDRLQSVPSTRDQTHMAQGEGLESSRSVLQGRCSTSELTLHLLPRQCIAKRFHIQPKSSTLFIMHELERCPGCSPDDMEGYVTLYCRDHEPRIESPDDSEDTVWFRNRLLETYTDGWAAGNKRFCDFIHRKLLGDTPEVH